MIYLKVFIFLITLSLAIFFIYYILQTLIECNITYIKSKSKVSKKQINELITNSKFDLDIINKITKNTPRLGEDFDLKNCKEFMQKYGLNFDLPLYMILLNNDYDFSQVMSEICSIKKLENQGVYTNLIIISNCSQEQYNKLKFAISQLDFVYNPCRLIERNNLISKDYLVLCKLNINYYCGIRFGQNVAKSTHYCLKSKNGECYAKHKSSTMQNGTIERLVLCKNVIEVSSVYDYKEDIFVNRFDMTGAKGEIKFSKFIPCDSLKYFDVAIADYKMCIRDFCQDKCYYFLSNLPIFSGAVFNKQGIYFDCKISAKYLYVFCLNKELKTDSIINCESYFIKAKSALESLPKVKVCSQNKELDSVINKTLPQGILNEFFKRQNMSSQSFRAFCTLDKSFLQTGKTTDKLTFLVNKYFALLDIYYGISFGEKGIYLSKQKDKLLDSFVSFKKENANYSIKIKKSNFAGDTFKFRGIEYTGTNYIPYANLSPSLILQM